MDPDDQAPNVASQQSSGPSSGATVMPNYSCLLPAPFDGTTDFQDFVTQFNSVASLSDWENHPSGDLRPQFFSARLSGDALSFYRPLTRAQQTNMNRLHAFRTQYAPSQDVLEAKVKALRQQPGQTIPVFFRVARFSPQCVSCLSRMSEMKSCWQLLLLVCLNPLFGGRFAQRNLQMLTVHCKQQWKLTLFLKSTV